MGYFSKEERQKREVVRITGRKEEERIRSIAASEERNKQIAQTAKFREVHKGERQRKAIKSGGIIGQFTGGFSAPKPMTRTVTIRGKKGKKGKRGKSRTVTRTVAPPKKESISEFFNNRYGGL